MHQVQKEVCQEILIEMDFDKMLEEQRSHIGHSNSKVTFDGNLIMDEVIQRLDKKGVPFSCTYLRSKDAEKDTATIGICILYSCYQDRDPNGKPTNILDESSFVILPRKTGGFSVDINLPMTVMEVNNPLYCEKMADYFGFWIGRAGLWTNAVIGLIEEATDRFLFSSSQGLEGLINQEKTHTSTHRQGMSCLPALISRRWDDCVNGSRYLVKQMIGLGHSIESKEARKLRKMESSNNELDDNAGNGSLGKSAGNDTRKDDSGNAGILKSGENEIDGGHLETIGSDEVGGSNSEMIWRRSSKKKTKKSMAKISEELMDYKSKLDLALVRGKMMGKFSYKEQSLRSKWLVIKDHVQVVRGNSDSIMGQMYGAVEEKESQKGLES
eukprot:scaffold58909_cov107-Cyclotella_meneghiniana.AAC.1